LSETALPVGTRPLSTLSGIGPALAAKLAARGLVTLQDLWLLLPRQYQDRTRLTPIAGLRHGQDAQIEGEVHAIERSFRSRPMLKVAIGDADGSMLTLRFFHFRQSQIAQFTPGTRLRCYGTPRIGQSGLEMVHPRYQILAAHTEATLPDSLDPVYPGIDGIGPARLRGIMTQALAALPDDAVLELLPADWLHARQLPTLRQSLLTLHQPAPDADIAALLAGHHPAQQRLALEELTAHHVSLRRQRITIQSFAAATLSGQRLSHALQTQLPFKLTTAQQHVLADIRRDLAQKKPMLRLLQGDVGCGKTVVAALAALAAVESGQQAALMAPTELLAEQHFATFRAWLTPLNINLTWLAGKITGKARTAALAAIADGRAQVVIGTHALMQQGVAFHSLALVIIDEQHRFGVHQRLALREKGSQGGRVPHQLVMTATPIPRTLAMAAYADLDVSIIDQLPPGRTPVKTVVLGVDRRPELIARIHHACLEGRQAYWVCTLIDESDEIAAQAAQTTFEDLGSALPGVRIGVVHGRQKPAEKQATMRAFKAGEVDVLVATTVIEVGVDVPNASLMVIENAERLGLAQLHQLRGRVGRGSAASSCVLLYQPPLSRLARERLDTLRRTHDGFVIAEKDLELRGPGEILGTRQTGLAEFKIADLMRDADLMPQVQQLADHLLSTRPDTADALVARWIGSAARYAEA